MSNLLAPQPRRRPRGDSKRTFMIVASQFNGEYVQGLVDHASAELQQLGPSATILLQRVPGAFEIPVVVKEWRRTQGRCHHRVRRHLEGETDHAENLSRSVTDALQRIAVDHGVPVINAVLSFDDEDQARERCLGNKINRGTEAGRAAVDMTNVMSDLRS